MLHRHYYPLKVTATCSWIKLVCHKLACITFPTESSRIFTTTSRYRGHSAIVQHNTNFATVHSQVTVGGCSVEYEYKLLRQFTTTVGGTRCYLWLKQSQSNSLQGHTKRFCSYLGIEQSGSGWKATGHSKNRYPVTLKTNYGELENFFQKHFVWPCSDVVQIDKTLVYGILCATTWANWRRSLYSYSTEQPPTVTRLCTVAKLVLYWPIGECPL